MSKYFHLKASSERVLYRAAAALNPMCKANENGDGRLDFIQPHYSRYSRAFVKQCKVSLDGCFSPSRDLILTQMLQLKIKAHFAAYPCTADKRLELL